MFVPVVDKDQKPLMPTTAGRARRWVESGKATPFWKRGVFCVRLNAEPTDRECQMIAVGIDPGSKREGFTVKSAAHTFLNIHAEARGGVKEAMYRRRLLRQARRQRNTPARTRKHNSSKGGMPPSTKARWGWKLRLVQWIVQMYPVSKFVVEDVIATTRSTRRRWNAAFSPLMQGKCWFYSNVEKLGTLVKKKGYETKAMRDEYGLSKTKKKLAVLFSAHCVDSWVLANSATGGHTKPDNEFLLCIAPYSFRRRSLHLSQPGRGGLRRRHGGTRSMGLCRGSIVTHPVWGVTYLGGESNSRVSLHSMVTGERLTRNARRLDIRVRSHAAWRAWNPHVQA